MANSSLGKSMGSFVNTIAKKFLSYEENALLISLSTKDPSKRLLSEEQNNLKVKQHPRKTKKIGGLHVDLRIPHSHLPAYHYEVTLHG